MVLAAGLLQIPVIKKAREMGYYVIAVDDDRCGNGDSDGWYPPQQAQPPLFCPMTDIYQINV